MRTVAELTDEADKLESVGQITAALELWREAAQASPRPDVVARLGRALLRAGMVDDGERVLRKAIFENPEHPDAYFFLGFHYETRGSLDEARHHLEIGVRLQEWGPAFTILGEVYRRLKLRDLARQSFAKAADLDPSDSEAWYGFGLTFSSSDPDKALELFRRAVQVNPSESAAHREIGHMQWRKGQLEAAVMSIRVALEINENDAWAHDYLGHLLMLSDSIAGAEQEFRRAIALWPDLPWFHCNLGDALARQHRMKEAEASYRTALSLDTNNAIANLRYGQLLKETGRPRKAKMYLQRALRADPLDSRAETALADIASIQFDAD
jgi:tetratricopeptide (TPR) repeat protein